ncbi:ACT domain-containing protein, partial [Oleiphilus sp. HI0086]
PGVASKILRPISDKNIEVDMIVQNVGLDKKTDFTFTVHRNDYKKAKAVLEEVCEKLGAERTAGDNDIAKVSIVGVG